MHLQAFLSERLQTTVTEIKPVGGGCINQTYKIITANKGFFCKINSASKFPHLFEKEKNGLTLIQKQEVIKTPTVIHLSNEDDKQILILEWIEEGIRNKQFWKTFGQELAALHETSHGYFGLEEDNYMGSIPQANTQQKKWVSFFVDQRIQPLLNLCADNNLLTSKQIEQCKTLYQRLPQIFAEEKPSLVHGDLWSGNFMCNPASRPVLIDPAVYFGHRSVDLAMTTLFGGFDKAFYESYQYHFPLPSNYKEQWQVCNLYPLLIHLILFGKSYLPQVEDTLTHFA